MPIYEYQCQSCQHELEALQKISDTPLEVCPECGERSLRKKVSAAAFRLKGGGWYETDFKTGDRKNIAGSGAEGSSDGGKGSSPGAEGSSSRAEGSSPRAEGSSSRAEGSSPRAEGSSPRAEGSSDKGGNKSPAKDSGGKGSKGGPASSNNSSAAG